MKKEKSKVIFGLMTAAVSFFLIAHTFAQSATSNYQNDISDCKTHIILNMVSQSADLDLVNAIDIKNELSVLTQEKSRLSTLKSTGDSGEVLRASAQKRAENFASNVKKLGSELPPLYRKLLISSILSNATLLMALILSILNVNYGLRIHGLYENQSRRDETA